GYVGGAEVRAAEADVGDQRVGEGHLLDDGPIGRDDRDTAVHQRADAYVAVRFDRQRVEQLVAGQAREERAAGRSEAERTRDLARRRHLPGPHAPRVGLGDVEVLLIG